MRYRKLRIAWSVVWGSACVLLIKLCVRSHSRWDMVAYKTGAKCYWVISVAGGVQFLADESKGMGWYYKVRVADMVPSIATAPYSFIGFKYIKSVPGSQAVYFVPSWFLILISGTLAAAPWLRRFSWRFSLRTLLIAMTLVALVLGLVVWSAK